MTGRPFAEETLTIGAAASGPTTATLRPTGHSSRIKVHAILEVLTESIFYTLQSAAATPDSGDHLGALGTVVEIEDVVKLRMIRSGGTNASVHLTYFQR